MKKGVSVRELALLGVLIIIAAYYFVVQGPVARETERLNTERSDLETQITEQSAKLSELQRMQAELEEVYAKAGGEPRALAPYSNNSVLLQELNVILNSTEEFDVTFGDQTITDGIMRREISVSYSTTSKDSSEAIVDMIENSNNAYLITSFETSSNDDGSQWSSSVSLVNYEYLTEEQMEALGVTDEAAADETAGESQDTDDSYGVEALVQNTVLN